MKRLSYFLLLAVLWLLASASASAKVFERWGSPNNDGPAARYSWSFAYESKMNLNGVDGVVRVYGVEKPMQDVLRELTDYYRTGGRNGEFFRGDLMSWGVGRDDKLAVRYFLQEGANALNTLVYEIKQPLDEYNRSLKKPLEHHLKKVPVYPGSEPGYFMHDYGTETALEVSSSSSSPESVTDFYHRSLSTQGWRTRLGDAGSMRIFEKGKEIILISASKDKNGTTQISRVHKKLNVK